MIASLGLSVLGVFLLYVTTRLPFGPGDLLGSRHVLRCRYTAMRSGDPVLLVDGARVSDGFLRGKGLLSTER